jgi:hypothetical protein
MDKYELVLKDLEEILNTIPEVDKVSQGFPTAITEEDEFTAIYISPSADSFELVKPGTTASSYNNILYIKLLVNIDCKDDDLYWVSIRRKIIDAVLGDNDIWSNIIDRNIVSIAYDDYGNHPLRELDMLFEFIIRESCVV